MKKFIFIMMAFLPIMLMAQSKVAVYVTSSSETVDETMKEIIGSEIVTAIVNNPAYHAVERTSEFLAQIKKEQGGELSGKVDDQQISELGKKFGVEYVCVANIMPYKDTYYVQARLIDVATVTVKNTAREISNLEDIEVIVETAEKLAQKLVGIKEEVQNDSPIEETIVVEQLEPLVVYDKEYSVVSTQTYNRCFITTINNSGDSTKVVFKLCAGSAMTACFSKNAYILDKKSGTKYNMLSAQDISTSKAMRFEQGIHKFTVYFEKMPSDVTEINIVESDDWKWLGIQLKPYGKKDYFKFEDNTVEYQIQLMNAEEQRKVEREQKKQETMDNIAEMIDNIAAYKLTVKNKRNCDFSVYLGDKLIGIIKGFEVKTIRIPLSFKGKIIFKQINGYLLFPTIKEMQSPSCKMNENRTYVID